jgi:flagellar biosynthesis GTPase FlhF
MCNVGIDAQLRALLLSEIEMDSSDEEAMELITTQLASNLTEPNQALAYGQMFAKPGVHLFAGPAGGGKTSMLAKIAYQLTQNYPAENILLISMSDTRPGAWSQLQMWAAKVGCPAMRALDQSTLETLLSENSGKFILIDTSADQINSMNSIERIANTHCHLVLPAHTPSAVIQKWMNPEKSLPWRDLYITRMDESTQPWALLKASMDYGICSAKASNGSGVEELVDNFDGQSLLAHSLLILKNALAPEVQSTTIAAQVMQQPAPKKAEETLHDSVAVSPALVDKPRRSRKYSTQSVTLQ